MVTSLFLAFSSLSCRIAHLLFTSSNVKLKTLRKPKGGYRYILSTMPTVKRERVIPGVHGDIQSVASPTPAPQPGFPYIPSSILNPLLLVILNLSISSAATALAAQYIGDEIGSVQKETPEEYWWYVVPGWRVLKALGAWWGGFDGMLHAPGI